jgi:hypothetical protein
MRPRLTSRIALVLALAAAPSVAVAQATTAAAGPSSADLQAAKAALAKYSDPLAAVRDGYFSTVACIDFPKGAVDGPIEYPPGAMGVHFLNPANIGPRLDPAKPQVLIYEPVGDKLVLAAAEWFMPVEASGGKAPSIFGQTLVGPMDGHEPIMPASLRHYDLHVWLWKDNPKGMFTSTNAALKCTAGATYTVAVGADHH